MKRSFKKGISVFVVVMFCLLAKQFSFAQKILARDSSTITPRYFNTELIKEFKSDADFRYQIVAEPASSLWDRFWKAFWNKVFRLFEATGGDKAVVWGFRIFAIAVIAFFIWQLTKMRASGMFSTSGAGKMGYSVSNEDIHSIDFDKEISEAVGMADYRLAVRLHYLQLLKKLADSRRISWRIDKTNLSYVNELRQADFYQSFRRLTIQFENNWYGHIPINRETYDSVTGEFRSLNSNLGG